MKEIELRSIGGHVEVYSEAGGSFSRRTRCRKRCKSWNSRKLCRFCGIGHKVWGKDGFFVEKCLLEAVQR